MFLVPFFYGEAEGTPAPTPYVHASGPPAHYNVSVLICFFSVMLFLALIFFIHPKLCYNAISRLQHRQSHQPNELIPAPLSIRISGTDEALINSLPSFRYSSFKGSKEGLDCSVCLSKYEDTEILRFLPKCKHAFHLNCVDQWLQNHRSCPLCRQKVEAEDIRTFKGSSILKFSQSKADHFEEAEDFQLFVHTPENDYGSSSFSVGSSCQTNTGNKDEGPT